MNNKYPKVLNWYYTLGEQLDPSLEVRTLDKVTWQTQNKLDAQDLMAFVKSFVLLISGGSLGYLLVKLINLSQLDVVKVSTQTHIT